ncbi:MAG TPA: LacI family transcriptional regulator [Clostridiaceae bacterium]|nr:LacI family transcriptional regulator [Clostridiaceae bacterium]
MKATLKDIAEHLNVSVSTVSRVINGKGRVGKETRERVLEAIKELNYQPNEIARSLKRQSSRTIGVIVPDISNAFYANIIKGIEKVARENEKSIIVCNSDENITLEEEYVQLLAQKQVIGLIVASVGGNAEVFKQYRQHGLPIVFIDNLPKIEDNYDFVAIDNYKASYKLAEHLIEQGYRKFAIITGPLNQSTASERQEGFIKCLKDNGIEINYKFIASGEFKLESGYSIMKKWLKGIDKPMALFAANNFIAYGAIKAINEEGLKIPEDIAVVCFDAVDVTGLIKPQITSVNQPAFDIGTIAANIIIRKEKNKKVKAYEKVILEPDMAINESSLLKK